MPYKVTKTNGYRVTSPHGVKAKRTTKSKAEGQARLLRAIKHGFKPTGKPARRVKMRSSRLRGRS